MSYWSFSLLKLLERMKETNLERVEIVALKEEGVSSWLVNLWSSSSPSLIEAFKNEGYTIKYEIYLNDTILIKKV